MRRLILVSPTDFEKMDRAQPFRIPLRTKFRLQQGRWGFNPAFPLTLYPLVTVMALCFQLFFLLEEARVCQR